MESDSFIFDDDIEEVGADTDAFCPKCKSDTGHTIITKYEEEIRRVQCSACGDVHAFRKPRGETDEEAALEPDKPSKRKVRQKPTWEEFFQKHDPSQGRPYSFRDTYVESDIVSHPKFGVGFASEAVDDDKVEITFRDSRRVLVHNRKELPGAPPELARPPKPRPVAKTDKKKRGALAKGKRDAKTSAKGMPAAPAKPQGALASGGKVKPAAPVGKAKPERVTARPASAKPQGKAKIKLKTKAKSKARPATNKAKTRPPLVKKARAAAKRAKAKRG
jgi:hypothetical protein